MALWLVLVACAIISTHSQYNGECGWGDFSIRGAQGYEIQCVDDGGTYAIAYTPCMSYALCNGQRYQSVYFNRFTGVCQHYLAEWDEGETEPTFRYNRDGDDIYTWTFQYTNGEICNGGERIFDVVWKCDPSAQPFSTNTLCGIVDDNECHQEMTIRSVYACIEGVIPTTEPTTEPTIEPTTDPTTDPTMEPTAVPTGDPTINPTMEPTARDDSSSGANLEDRDVVIISLSVVMFILLVIIGGFVYYRKCKKGGQHALLREKSGNQYNSMNEDNLQLATKE